MFPETNQILKFLAHRMAATLVIFLAFVAHVNSKEFPKYLRLTASKDIQMLTKKFSSQPSLCTSGFVTHNLDHFTSVPGNSIDQFEANGSGLAIGDLDADGDLDIVLANHNGLNTILWNRGLSNTEPDFTRNFEKEQMPFGDTRAVNLVDVDADGLLDIVLTRRTGALNYFRNLGKRKYPNLQTGSESRLNFGVSFIQEILPGISYPAYTLNWGDLDYDGDLDLVTGSYNASLLSDLGQDYLLNHNTGVFIYNQDDGQFISNQLADTSQAMAIILFDINRDGYKDILVGNDFAVQDYVWLNNHPSIKMHTKLHSQRNLNWEQFFLDTTSYSTMSLDVGDVNNDGFQEIFSTDMMPYDELPETVAAYEPLMAEMDHDRIAGDPQVMANVLLMHSGILGYQDVARSRGLDSSGWSWSAKFADLDQDGFQDLYVVNGMAEATVFSHLPNHELVEANQAFRNMGNGFFRPTPEWSLGSTLGGRGMSMGDLDSDGDLDIVVNNLRGPAQLFENRICQGESIIVDLRWKRLHNSENNSEQRIFGNTHAVGTILTLHTSAGTFTRDVRVASGYLSGDPPQVHFGFPHNAELYSLEIQWPDRFITIIENPQTMSLLTVKRFSGFKDQSAHENYDDLLSSNTAEIKKEDTPLANQKVNDKILEFDSPKIPELFDEQTLNDKLYRVINEANLTGDPSRGIDFPHIEDPLPQLGMKLFFSKALGGDLDIACASCHHPFLAGGDGLSTSIGVGAKQPDILGPGRTHSDGPNVSRNAQSTFNVGFYRKVLFFDGRIEVLDEKESSYNLMDLKFLKSGIRTPETQLGIADLEIGNDLIAAQSHFPVASREEMRGFEFEAYRPPIYARHRLISRLGDFGNGQGELHTNLWEKEFEAVFGKRENGSILINQRNVAAALSAYQRSQVFVDNPWRAYVQRKEHAISDSAKRGALLFFTPVDDGGAGCSTCHSGDFFTDEKFHVLAIPQIGPGKEDGPYNDDFGRFRESGDPADFYAFRTPTLLNVEVTGPYGHSGAYTSLKGIVNHHLNPAIAVAEYDDTQLDPAVQTDFLLYNTERALAKLEENRRSGLNSILDLRLKDEQVDDLISFLLTLTDPCIRQSSCLASWVPDEKDTDPDGLRIGAEISYPVTLDQ